MFRVSRLAITAIANITTANVDAELQLHFATFLAIQ